MKSVVNYINGLLFPLLPETNFFGLKRFLLRCAGVKVGANVRVCSSVRILGAGNLEIGANTWIGHRVLIISSSNIKIGENVDIAPKVYIGTGTHKIEADGMRVAGCSFSKDVEVGNGAWIGACSCILPGVKVGKMVVVAAGAVVTNSFDDRTLIGGIPAQEIKKI